LRKPGTAKLPALVLAFFLSAAALSGQSGGIFSRPLTGRNRSRFEAVCVLLSEHPLVRGDFTQTKLLRRQGRSLVSKGRFVIDAERGMLWETTHPYASAMAVGRDYLIQSSGGKKTKLDTAGNETFLRIAEIISAVFSGGAGILTENFEVYFFEDTPSWHMGLVPKDSTVRNFAASIVMRGDTVLRSVTLNEGNGDSVSYELSGHHYPKVLSPRETELFSP
jgi:hypothetical protein